MSTRVAILFGYGSRVAVGVVDKFVAEGYKVATVSRSPRPELAGKTEHIAADLGDVHSIDVVFNNVTSKLGPVNTVIYNAYTIDYSDATNPFKAPVSYLQHSQAVGINSAYRAAQLLLESTAPASQKHFIYTGNMLHRSPHPAMLGLGMEKAGAVHFIAVGAKAYGAQGGPFFYNAWESNPDGSPPANEVNSEAHAQIFWNIVQSSEQGPYDLIFVKGEAGAPAKVVSDLKI